LQGQADPVAKVSCRDEFCTAASVWCAIPHKHTCTYTICTYRHLQADTQAHTHTLTHTHKHTHTQIQTHTHTHTNMKTHMHTQLRILKICLYVRHALTALNWPVLFNF
jgi:hypothetical protein